MLKGIALPIWLVVLTSCAGVDTRRVDQITEEVQKQFCPDRRLAVFDVTSNLRGRRLILAGEVSSPAAKEALRTRVEDALGASAIIVDSLVVLPHPDLGKDTVGIVRISVANMRKEPDYASELVNQALMGSELRLLKKQDGWYYVQAPDGYLGWMSEGEMVIADAARRDHWRSKSRVIVTGNFGEARESPRGDALPLSDLVWGDVLAGGEPQGDWIPVELPDGRRGFVEKRLVRSLSHFAQNKPPSPQDIVHTAYRFLGYPYLWGGTSPKGFDCSGFTAMIYRMNGIQLLRDASQQARLGQEVAPGEKFENLRPGDLLCFGRNPDRITHVGIYIGGQRFIHSSDLVRINSFDPEAPDYDAYRHRTFQKAKRIL